MIVLVQRVQNVKVNSELFIGKGLLLFSGFSSFDNKEIVAKMVSKILSLRVFGDENEKTNLSIKEVSGEILSISQFTLYSNLRGYNRPSFSNCLEYSKAKELFDYFNEQLLLSFPQTKKGIFGSDYQVTLTNDGPFTIILDSEKLFS